MIRLYPPRHNSTWALRLYHALVDDENHRARLQRLMKTKVVPRYLKKIFNFVIMGTGGLQSHEEPNTHYTLIRYLIQSLYKKRLSNQDFIMCNPFII